MDNKILRIKDVSNLVKLSRSTIYRLIKTGDFPDKIQLSERIIGFRYLDILDWMENK